MEIVIGVITTTHGIKGELKVKSMTDFERFVPGKLIYTVVNDKRITLKISTQRENKGMTYLTFEGFTNINEVLFLKGATIYSDEDLSNELKDDEFLITSLINLVAITKEEQVLGTVTDVVEAPQGHLLSILTNDGRMRLVPFRKEFVGEVTDKTITIFPIDGLL